MISAVGYGQTNPTSTPNGIRIANGVESIPPSNYKIPYIDPVTKVLKDYIDPSLVQDTKIPDWSAEQPYKVGSVVHHNGGIWRSETHLNTTEPVEGISNFEIEESRIYLISMNPTTEVIPAGSFVDFSCSMVGIPSKVKVLMKTISDLPIGTSCGAFVAGETYAYIPNYTPGLFDSDLPFDCSSFDDYGRDYYLVGYTLPSEDDGDWEDEFETIPIGPIGTLPSLTGDVTPENLFRVYGCPYPQQIPMVESTSEWTLLAQVNEKGNWMVRDGVNKIDPNEWLIQFGEPNYMLTLQPWETEMLSAGYYDKETWNTGGFGLGADNLYLYKSDQMNEGSSEVTFNSKGIISDFNNYQSSWRITYPEQMGVYAEGMAHLILPITGEGRVAAVSVNGEFADESGNIEIDIETPDLENVLSQGSEATNTITLNHPNTAQGKITYGPLSVLRTNSSETVGTTFHIEGENSGVKIVSNDEDGQAIGQGLFSDYYYGENYQDNTYVQKKYVDDSIPRFAEESFLYSEPGEVFNLSEEPREIVSVEVNRVPIYLNSDYFYNGTEVDISNYPLFSGDKIIIKYNY